MGSGYAIVGLLTFLTHSRDNNLDMTQWPAWCWAIHGVECPLSDMIRGNYMKCYMYKISNNSSQMSADSNLGCF